MFFKKEKEEKEEYKRPAFELTSEKLEPLSSFFSPITICWANEKGLLGTMGDCGGLWGTVGAEGNCGELWGAVGAWTSLIKIYALKL